MTEADKRFHDSQRPDVLPTYRQMTIEEFNCCAKLFHSLVIVLLYGGSISAVRIGLEFDETKGCAVSYGTIAFLSSR